MKAYIVYRIALCIHLEVYLMLSILILNETIRVDLIVFLAIFADVATIAIAYDNAPYARRPVDWQLPKVWIISSVMGLLLAGGTWIVRGTLFLSNGGIVQNFGSVQEILFLEVALTESWVIFITRMAQDQGTPFVWPSWQLIGAVLGVDILATIFALFGWISGPAVHGGWTDIVTVVRIWLYSAGVMVVLTFAYIMLNKIRWLDNIGRRNRSTKNKRLEDFLSELQRLTLVHENDESGDHYRFAASKEKQDEGEQSGKAKGGKAQDNDNKKKGNDTTGSRSGTATPKGNEKSTKNGMATPGEPGSKRSGMATPRETEKPSEK